jgi:Ser/Thr protein kinase RdoA (MazF antagonist)
MDQYDRPAERETSDRFERLARKALAAYGLEEARLHAISHATHVILEVHDESDAVEGTGHFALRICPRGWDRSQLTREFLWLGKLRREENLAVPEPVLTRSGELFRNVSVPGVSGFRYVALLRWVEGISLPVGDWTSRDVRRIGRVIGQLHLHAASFAWPAELACPRRNEKTLETSIDPTRLARRVAPERIETLRDAVELVCRSMRALGTGPDVAGVIHANLRPENVLLHDEEARAIGFAGCRWGYSLYDLATIDLALRDEGHLETNREELLSGYCEARPLPDLWSDHLDAFAALRLLDVLQRHPSPLSTRTTAESPTSVERTFARLQRIVERSSEP